MAGKVSRRAGSVTMSTPYSLSWLEIISACAALVATVMLSSSPASLIWRTTRCTIDSFSPSGDFSKRRNCFACAPFDKGHKRWPEPPDNKIISCLCYNIFARHFFARCKPFTRARIHVRTILCKFTTFLPIFEVLSKLNSPCAAIFFAFMREMRVGCAF